MKSTEAIILAGGKGTRLQSVITDMPKPMALIGETPFLEYLLNYLESYGIEHVILSVGYKWDIIKAHFGTQYRTMEISYAVEEEPLGTGGGIRKAMNMLKGEHTYILNGDTFFEVNLFDLGEFYFAHQCDMSMTVKRFKDFFRYGTVELDVCKVTGFKEKQPRSTGLINGGIYMTSKHLFDKFELPEKFSFETDFLQKYLPDIKICAMRCSEYFIDIGVPADYEKATKDLPAKSLL